MRRHYIVAKSTTLHSVPRGVQSAELAARPQLGAIGELLVVAHLCQNFCPLLIHGSQGAIHLLRRGLVLTRIRDGVEGLAARALVVGVEGQCADDVRGLLPERADAEPDRVRGLAGRCDANAVPPKLDTPAEKLRCRNVPEA